MVACSMAISTLDMDASVDIGETLRPTTTSTKIIIKGLKNLLLTIFTTLPSV